MITKYDLSREHCLLEREGDKYFITDLGSKNGVCVDRIRLKPHEKKAVSETSHIVLANIYNLRINSWDVKTRADVVIKNQEINESQTVTFELELPAGIEARPKRQQKRIKLKEEAESSSRTDSLRMVIGFIVILGLALYQAFGK